MRLNFTYQSYFKIFPLLWDVYVIKKLCSSYVTEVGLRHEQNQPRSQGLSGAALGTRL